MTLVDDFLKINFRTRMAVFPEPITKRDKNESVYHSLQRNQSRLASRMSIKVVVVAVTICLAAYSLTVPAYPTGKTIVL